MATSTLWGPYLEEIKTAIVDASKYLLLFVRYDRALRLEQAENSPLADGFQQGTIIATALTRFDAATSGVRKYSYIEVLIEDTAGSCRYTVDASEPTAAGRGHKVPAGGSTITIPGAENVKNFKIIAETGQTAEFTMQGFY